MAYTTPRTWTAGETVTAAMMNSDVRDNVADVYSKARTKTISIEAINWEEPTYKGTAHRWVVPAVLNGGVVTAAEAAISTAGTAGTVAMQVERVRGTAVASMLSTTAKIDATELTSYTGTSGAINATYQGLATGDWLNIVVADHGGGTATANAGQKGLFAILTVTIS